RHRLAALPETARTVLRQAAVIGRDLDPDVLAEVAGDRLLDALDLALAAGFLTEDGQLRFTHVLVRDTLYGDLSAARRAAWRAEAVAAAERLGDPEQTASVIAAFDVPAVWARNDDEELSRRIVEAAERTLAVLPAGRADQRSRLLSTIALELRGTTTDRGYRA